MKNKEERLFENGKFPHLKTVLAGVIICWLLIITCVVVPRMNTSDSNNAGKAAASTQTAVKKVISDNSSSDKKSNLDGTDRTYTTTVQAGEAGVDVDYTVPQSFPTE